MMLFIHVELLVDRRRFIYLFVKTKRTLIEVGFRGQPSAPTEAEGILGGLIGCKADPDSAG